MINICVFEDAGYLELYPMTYARPVYDTLIGITSIFDKIYSYFNYGNISLHCREYLKGSVKEKYTDFPVNSINFGTPCLFINGRVVMTHKLYDLLSNIDKNENYLFLQNEQVIAAYLRSDQLTTMKEALQSTPSSLDLIKVLRKKCITKEIESIMMITHPWDLFAVNSIALITDFQDKNKPGIIKAEVSPFTKIQGDTNVFIDKGTVIEDFVYINATKGPVYIEKDVYIQSHTRLEGPLYIGHHTQVLGGKIKGSSIGPFSKISGEVSDCIFQGYSNKAHAGFMGHSYVGEWVNLGAGTTVSNLKNNYRPITVDSGKNKLDSGRLFLGAIIGDHVKTSIQTMLNSGTLVNYGSTLFEPGFHDRFIAAFTWGKPTDYEKHKLDKFLASAEMMMKRRDVKLSNTTVALIKYLYKNTKHVS